MSYIEIRRLTKVFPDGTVALNPIDLTVNPNEFIVLAGANGSGKTVLAKHLIGLMTPTSGQVMFKSVPIEKNLQDVRQAIGFIFQDSDNQIVGQTVGEDVAFGPKNLRLPMPEVEARVSRALDVVGMSSLRHQRPAKLSGGQKRKVAIAGILAMNPEVVILDEPFTGLDLPGVVQVLSEIVRLHQGGHTIIVITHELEKVLAHATRLIVMDRGNVVKDGPPQTLLGEVEAFGLRIGCPGTVNLENMTWLR